PSSPVKLVVRLANTGRIQLSKGFCVLRHSDTNANRFRRAPCPVTLRGKLASCTAGAQRREVTVPHGVPGGLTRHRCLDPPCELSGWCPHSVPKLRATRGHSGSLVLVRKPENPCM